jgi:hypothetical protein
MGGKRDSAVRRAAVITGLLENFLEKQQYGAGLHQQPGTDGRLW